MEYAVMLVEPSLIVGLLELLDDSETAVVKRTIRVFANIYRHSFVFFTSGELDESVFLNAWPQVRGVTERIFGMVLATENEGILIHLIRFLENVLTTHLTLNLSQFPKVFSDCNTVTCSGIETLVKLLSTPYIGGSVYVLGASTLVTVTCHKPDLKEKTIELLEKQIVSPPPTLFDHNIRSLHKMLQRQLFRLLQKTYEEQFREKLIDLMVSVGVPRKNLTQRASIVDPRKRPHEDSHVLLITSYPPEKLRRKELKPAPKTIPLTQSDETKRKLSPLPESPQSPPPESNVVNNVSNLIREPEMQHSQPSRSTNAVPSEVLLDEKQLFDLLELSAVVELIFATIVSVPDEFSGNDAQKLADNTPNVLDEVTIRESIAHHLALQLREEKETAQSIAQENSSVVCSTADVDFRNPFGFHIRDVDMRQLNMHVPLSMNGSESIKDNVTYVSGKISSSDSRKIPYNSRSKNCSINRKTWIADHRPSEAPVL